MTKQELIEAIKDYPDDALVKFFDSQHLWWQDVNIYWADNTMFNDEHGNKINNFIGIE